VLKKISLLSGFAAGYVLGAKAGTERYDQIRTAVDELMGKPQVQKATGTITQTASDLGDKAKETVNDKVESVTSSAAAKKPVPETPMKSATTAGSSPDVAMSTGATGATGGSGTTRAPGATGAPGAGAPAASGAAGAPGATSATSVTGGTGGSGAAGIRPS